MVTTGKIKGACKQIGLESELSCVQSVCSSNGTWDPSSIMAHTGMKCARLG